MKYRKHHMPVCPVCQLASRVCKDGPGLYWCFRCNYEFRKEW